MAKRRVVLRTRTFEKLGDASSFFSGMLNKYNIGSRVDDEDAKDLSALLERHSEFEEKAGTGVIGFEVNTPPSDMPQFSKRCFWIIRSDGSKMDFSIGNCLKAQACDQDA